MLSLEDIVVINEALAQVLAMLNTMRLGPLQLAVKRFQLSSTPLKHRLRGQEHPFFEWVFAENGVSQYHVAGKEIELTSDCGHFFFVPPGITHTRITNTRRNLLLIIRFSIISRNNFGLEVLQNLKNTLFLKHYFLPYSETMRRLTEERHQLLLEKPPLWLELVENNIRSFILTAFCENCAGIFTGDASHKARALHLDIRKAQIIQTIENALDTQLGREGLSQLLGVSGRHLSRLVHEYTGLPMNQYIRYRRIEAAKEILGSRGMLVKQVAASLGYKDVSYFCRIFKSVTGMTPKQFAANSKFGR